MKGRAHRTIGLTLIEMTLVVATMALLAGLALPAVRVMIDSFQSEGGTKSIIQAALKSARVMAMTHQRYVGVRFQKACTSNDPCDPLKGELNAPQYMIFIMQDEPKNMGGLGNGFKAMEGHEPIKLPDTIGVMEPDRWKVSLVAFKELGAPTDATTFSIVFAPSGRLVVHQVRVRNRDGVYRPSNAPGSTKTSYDDIFNSIENSCRYKQGMFLQDDYSKRNRRSSSDPADPPEFELGQEESVTSFIMYDVATLRTLLAKGPGYVIRYFNFDPLKSDKAVYVNSHTGDLLSSD